MVLLELVFFDLYGILASGGDNLFKLVNYLFKSATDKVQITESHKLAEQSALKSVVTPNTGSMAVKPVFGVLKSLFNLLP